MIPAANAAQGAVSRAAGSPITFSSGRNGMSARTPSTYSRFVTTRMFSTGRSCRSRSTVISIIVASPRSCRNCFGRLTRLCGQNRSPFPPAITTA